MVSHLTMRIYGVNQAFRFVEGIWLHQKSRQIREKKIGKDLFCIIPAQHALSYHGRKHIFANLFILVGLNFFLCIHMNGIL
mgnify:CR=1 FL=1